MMVSRFCGLMEKLRRPRWRYWVALTALPTARPQDVYKRQGQDFLKDCDGREVILNATEGECILDPDAAARQRCV